MKRLFERWAVGVRVDRIGYFLVFGCEEDAIRTQECCRHFRDYEMRLERRYVLRLSAARKGGV
jgi:hypothetical protein